MVCFSQKPAPQTFLCRACCIWIEGKSIAWWYIMKLWNLIASKFSFRIWYFAISALALKYI